MGSYSFQPLCSQALRGTAEVGSNSTIYFIYSRESSYRAATQAQSTDMSCGARETGSRSVREQIRNGSSKGFLTDELIINSLASIHRLSSTPLLHYQSAVLLPDAVCITQC